MTMKPAIAILAGLALGAMAQSKFVMHVDPKAGTNVLVVPTNFTAWNTTFEQPFWRVETNWVDTGIASMTLMFRTPGQPDPNVTTYEQRGTVTSNLVLRVTYDKAVKEVVLKSEYVAYLSRGYTIKEVREYK
jgi:hypothetical protein